MYKNRFSWANYTCERHLFALDALCNLKNRGHKAKLFIIGDQRGYDNYFKEILDKVAELDLKNNVVFTGFIDNPYQYIANMDLLFMPYSIEPFGRTLLESWQLKTPVVLSDVGHINDVVQHRENGMLFQFGNIESCTNCLESIINSKELQKKIIINGYQTFYETYRPNNYSARIEAVYKNICHS